MLLRIGYCPLIANLDDRPFIVGEHRLAIEHLVQGIGKHREQIARLRRALYAVDMLNSQVVQQISLALKVFQQTNRLGIAVGAHVDSRYPTALYLFRSRLFWFCLDCQIASPLDSFGQNDFWLYFASFSNELSKNERIKNIQMTLLKASSYYYKQKHVSNLFVANFYLSSRIELLGDI
ncbi:MAG: hypothetical protein Q7S37_03250 [bacterium]|nr:hypothetical protein [bacterium]